jgi:hypothetical protein
MVIADQVFIHPSLEPVLKRTLGVPLFQEQLLRMAAIAVSQAPTLRGRRCADDATARPRFIEFAIGNLLPGFRFPLND